MTPRARRSAWRARLADNRYPSRKWLPEWGSVCDVGDVVVVYGDGPLMWRVVHAPQPPAAIVVQAGALMRCIQDRRIITRVIA